VVWSLQKFLPNVPSPLYYEDVLYIVKDGGILTSLDPKTGEHNPEVLRKVAQAHGNFAGVYCAVLVEGTLKKGDLI